MTSIVWTKGGGTKDGYYAFKDGDKKVFHCPHKEMKSIKLNENDIVIDIGAYTGQYAMICAQYPVKEIRSYEPTKKSFEVLQKYEYNNFKCYNLAVVGNDDEERKFYISKGIGVCNSLIKKRTSTEQVVKCIKYNKIIADATIIKIDIEGGEYEIKDLIQPHIRAYIIDFHKVGKTWLDEANDIIKKLDDYGYECIVKPNFSCGWTMAGSWIKSI